MNKTKVYNILLGLGLMTGIYLFASKVYRKYKSMTKGLQDGLLYIEELQGQLLVLNQQGEVVVSYDIPEQNMGFPLSLDEGCHDGIEGGCEKYINVQKLQTVLLFQPSSLPYDISADGQFGYKTEAALVNYLNSFSPDELVSFGYETAFVAAPSSLNYVTEDFYSNDVLIKYETITG